MAASGNLINKVIGSFGSKINKTSEKAAKSFLGRLDDNVIDMLEKDDKLFTRAMSDFKSSWNPMSRDGVSQVEKTLPRAAQKQYANQFTKSVNQSTYSEMSSRVKGANKYLSDGSLNYEERLSGVRSSLGGIDPYYYNNLGKRGQSLNKNLNDLESRVTQQQAARAEKTMTNQMIKEQIDRFGNTKKLTRQDIKTATKDAIKNSASDELGGDIFNQRVSDNLSGTLNKRYNDMSARLDEKASFTKQTKETTKDSIEDVMTKKQKFIMEREGHKYDYDNLNKSYTDPEKLRSHISGLTGDAADTLGSEDAMRASLKAGLNKRASNPTVMDNLSYHKVPQMAAGIGTTAWLVSRLDSSKGQMSNSQLYGQQQY